MQQSGLGWLGIVRLGLVQAALGAIVVLTTSTLNRVMVVELSLAAVVPGLLVGLHYGVQIARPLWGYGSDRGGGRAVWIAGGMALLALAGTGAAASAAIMAHSFALGFALALVDFVLIGIGVGAAGTSLLALLAASVAPERRAAAATLAWLMMIAGIALTAVVSGIFLDPFSFGRLVAVTAATGAIALLVTLLALWRVEKPGTTAPNGREEARAPFRIALADAWREREARLFTVFVFVSMLGYSMQDLVLEPYAGLVFGLTPGQSTQLSGLQNGGVFGGMVLVGVAGSLLARRFPAILGYFMFAGCVLSACALLGLGMSATAPRSWPLSLNVAALGFSNGMFAVAAIASMMALAGNAGPGRVGLRMGLWGAAQGVAFGLGGFAGTVAVDLLRLAGAGVEAAYGTVFLLDGATFLVAALVAARIGLNAGFHRAPRRSGPARMPGPLRIQPAE